MSHGWGHYAFCEVWGLLRFHLPPLGVVCKPLWLRPIHVISAVIGRLRLFPFSSSFSSFSWFSSCGFLAFLWFGVLVFLRLVLLVRTPLPRASRQARKIFGMQFDWEKRNHTPPCSTAELFFAEKMGPTEERFRWWIRFPWFL